jgi:hypothetical protein
MKFSNGWIEVLKKRNEIKSYRLAGKSASADENNL